MPSPKLTRRLQSLEARIDSVMFEGRQKYRDWNDDDVPPGSISSPKLDGIYAKASRDGIFTKTGKRIEGQARIEKRLKKHFRKNPDSSLEGELYRKQPLEQTVSDMKKKKSLQLHLFPGQGKTPLGYGSIRNIKGKTVKTKADAERHYDKLIRKGHEGQVIQTPSGERIRRKAMDDSEFDVDDVSVDRKGRSLAGVSDGKTKSSVLVSRESQVKKGDRVTVQHQGRTRSGKLRSPRFKAVRDYE